MPAKKKDITEMTEMTEITEITDSEVFLDEKIQTEETEDAEYVITEELQEVRTTETTEIQSNSENKVSPKNQSVNENRVLKIVRREELSTEHDLVKTTLHELSNSRVTGTILSGKIAGVEKIKNNYIAIVYYKGVKVIIPDKEMELPLNRDTSNIAIQRMLNSMVSSEIDFIVRGIDDESETAVASRKSAMRKKRRMFYFPTDVDARIDIGKLVQARILSVREKSMIIEAFGVQYILPASEVDYTYITNLRDTYFVGDKVIVRINEIKYEDDFVVTIKADIKSTKKDNSLQKLLSLNIRSSYLGTITDIRHGTIYVLLTCGVNAIAHDCTDRKTPTKGDEISFLVKQLNNDSRLAIGIITKIVRQNIF